MSQRPRFNQPNDKIIIGLLLGIAIPFVSYALLLELYDQLDSGGVISDVGMSETFRKRTIALLAVCMNLIPFTYFSRTYRFNSMRGIIFPTVAYAIGWLIYFREGIL